LKDDPQDVRITTIAPWRARQGRASGRGDVVAGASALLLRGARLPKDQEQQREEMRMCRVFAGQDARGFAQVSRTVRIGGHCTSIRIEAAFWDVLDEIARSQGLSTPKFLSLLWEEALELQEEVPNFASMLRTTCLLHLRGARPSEVEIEQARSAA
jgi:predicted DNA-binding ribbon-helix-helix protein